MWIHLLLKNAPNKSPFSPVLNLCLSLLLENYHGVLIMRLYNCERVLMGINGLGYEVEKSEVSEGQTDMLIFGIFVDFFLKW